jgi:hypothetical protein
MSKEAQAIIAAHPLNTGRHDLYAEAMRLVGARHGKGELVELVNWLLAERDALRADMETLQGINTEMLNEHEAALATARAEGRSEMLIEVSRRMRGEPVGASDGGTFVARMLTNNDWIALREFAALTPAPQEPQEFPPEVVEAVARAIVGPWLPVPDGCQFTLDQLRDVRWRRSSPQEQGMARTQALAALRTLAALGYRRVGEGECVVPKRRLKELLETEAQHAIYVAALSEIKATVEGHSPQSVPDILAGCVAEVRALPLTPAPQEPRA